MSKTTLSEMVADLQRRADEVLGPAHPIDKWHPEDYSALSNWRTHDEVRDSEISLLVVQLANHGMRVAEIEALMKDVLLKRLAEFEQRAGDDT